MSHQLRVPLEVPTPIAHHKLCLLQGHIDWILLVIEQLRELIMFDFVCSVSCKHGPLYWLKFHTVSLGLGDAPRRLVRIVQYQRSTYWCLSSTKLSAILMCTAMQVFASPWGREKWRLLPKTWINNQNSLVKNAHTHTHSSSQVIRTEPSHFSDVDSPSQEIAFSRDSFVLDVVWGKLVLGLQIIMRDVIRSGRNVTKYMLVFINQLLQFLFLCCISEFWSCAWPGTGFPNQSNPVILHQHRKTHRNKSAVRLLVLGEVFSQKMSMPPAGMGE